MLLAVPTEKTLDVGIVLFHLVEVVIFASVEIQIRVMSSQDLQVKWSA